jgi:hypothetical protein
VGPKGWESALAAADGVVTFWNEEAASNRKITVSRKKIHTAAMVPFTLSGQAFFGQTLNSLEALKKQIQRMEEAGFDEAIIAYRDMEDLEAAGGLIG